MNALINAEISLNRILDIFNEQINIKEIRMIDMENKGSLISDSSYLRCYELCDYGIFSNLDLFNFYDFEKRANSLIEIGNPQRDELLKNIYLKAEKAFLIFNEKLCQIMSAEMEYNGYTIKRGIKYYVLNSDGTLNGRIYKPNDFIEDYKFYKIHKNYDFFRFAAMVLNYRDRTKLPTFIKISNSVRSFFIDWSAKTASEILKMIIAFALLRYVFFLCS